MKLKEKRELVLEMTSQEQKIYQYKNTIQKMKAEKGKKYYCSKKGKKNTYILIIIFLNENIWKLS